jgi:hypothetical protein
MSGEEEGWCAGREDLREEIIEWIEKNRHEVIYGALRENVVNMEKLLEFINKGEK